MHPSTTTLVTRLGAVLLAAIAIGGGCSDDQSVIGPGGAGGSGADTSGLLDTSVLDTLAADTSKADVAIADATKPPVDTNPQVDAGPASACTSKADCQGSEECLAGPAGMFCAPGCETDSQCPEGAVCAKFNPVMVKKVCQPAIGWLCRPCAKSAECWTGANPGAACVGYDSGDSGHFCANACAADTDCPSGFECLDRASAEGASGKYCVAAAEAGGTGDGTCTCSPWAAAQGWSTACKKTTVTGEGDSLTCSGVRTCSPGGLSACSATDPETEKCDGIDNDCDGQTDEATCDDGNPCTKEACGGAKGCSSEPVAADCDADGDACTPDACKDGKCEAGTPKACDDDNVCTKDSCDPKTGDCKHAQLEAGANCDDGNACTKDDACTEGSCAGKVAQCDDNNPCTDDGCDPKTGCTNTPNTAPCDDGDKCSLGEQCANGACAGAKAKSCDDDNVCTKDACDGASGDCTHDELVTECDDGNKCTTEDKCQAGKCAGTAKDCDDGNPCTTNFCNTEGGCEFKLNTVPCDDNDKCTDFDACSGGKCQGQLKGKADCDDGNPCTSHGCDPKTGCTSTNNTDPCDDGSACTVGDLCDSGKCVAGTNTCDCTTNDDCAKNNPGNVCLGTLYCDKSNAPFKCKINPATVVKCDSSQDSYCAENQCDPKSGTCAMAALHEAGPCDADNSACTADDKCVQGKCTAGAAQKCDDSNPCTDDKCDPKTGCTYTANATPCDADGNACTVGDACKDKVCIGGAKKVCDDGNVCTSDKCDPKTGQCGFDGAANDGDKCDADSSVCTVGDACKAGSCVKGTLQSCDDNNPCTTDTCDPKSGCANAANTSPCDADGNACTVGDVCQDKVCIQGKAKSCDDAEACTKDSCDPKTGKCAFDGADSEGLACNADDSACTVGDKCISGVCTKGAKQDCDDSNACTTDLCDPKLGCVQTAIGGNCDDGDACTDADLCQAGKCTGKPKTCDDNNPCTTDTCDPKSGCKTAPLNAKCSDGNDCTVGDECQNGKCASGTNICGCQADGDCKDKEDGNPCTGTLFCNKGKVPYQCEPNPVTVVKCDLSGDSYCKATKCDPADGKCKAGNQNEGKICDADGSTCTVGDKCVSGACVAGPKLDCDDKNPCTNDVCDPVKGCVNTANAAPCDFDGDACTVNDTCSSGVCKPGPKKSCDDGDACTKDACDTQNGQCSNAIIVGCGGNCTDVKHCNDNDICTDDACVKGKCSYVFKSGDCDDGNKCTEKDACVQGKCTGAPVSCEDANPCTNDGCAPASGCVHLNNNIPCTDFDGCTLGDACTDGKCVAGQKKPCDDNDKCTTDSCNPATGQCIFKGIPGCGGYCSVASDCDDKNVCTDEACDKGKCVSTFNTKTCDDGDKCTVSDVCDGGKCAGAKKDCDDKNACTVDSCEASSGNCLHTQAKPGDACDDGDACTSADACADVGGKISCSGKAKNCDDGNVCTDDGCEAASGKCTALANTAACEDGNKCTAGDLCAGGKCVTGTKVWVDTMAGSNAGHADGKGAAAMFNTPYGAVADAAGNVYVADSLNHVVRKIAVDGTVTTLAGQAGKAGLLDGKGAAAMFNLPFGLAMDVNGDLIVADRDSHAIRRLTVDGVVTTIAGDGTQGAVDGDAKQARFYHPWGVTVTNGGVIYVADRTNNRVRKIAGGKVSTLAGTTYGYQDDKGLAARFAYPVDVAADAEGNVFVADEQNHRIRKVTADGVVTTVAGSTAGYLDGQASTARFNRPWGIAVDGSGTLWVADRYNHRIRRIAAGAVTTYASAGAGWQDGESGQALFLYPAALSVNASGHVFVADANNHRVRRLRDSKAPCTISGVCYVDGTTDAANSCQACIAASSTSGWTAISDGAGCSDGDPCTTKDMCKTGKCAGSTISCDDNDKCTMDSCDKKTGGCDNAPIIGCGGNCAQDSDCADKNDCNWGARCQQGKCTAGGLTELSTVAGSGSAGYNEGQGKDAMFNRPYGLDADGAGALYVADRYNHRIRKVTLADNKTALVAGNGFAGWADGAATKSQFNYPGDVEVAANGTVYVADTNNHRIRSIAKDGTVDTVAGSSAGANDGKGAAARFYYPYGIASNAKGVLYVADYNNNRIRRVTAGGEVTTLAGSTAGFADGTGNAARFNRPMGVAVDAAGNVVVADYLNARLRSVTPEGVVTTIAGSGVAGYQDGVAASARFDHPWGIDVDASGNVYVADHSNRRIRKLDTKGIVTLFAGTSDGFVDGEKGVGRMRPPIGVTVDERGYVYVGDYANHAVRRARDTAATCFIGGKCWTGGITAPGASCQACDAVKSGTSWTTREDGAACDDGQLCTRPDTCATGKCVAKTVVCDDKSVCTTDACDATTGGCVYTPIVGCNGYCDADAQCNDKNVCTTDTCVGNKCNNATNNADCDDNNPCTIGDICAGGSCNAGDKTWIDTFAGSSAGHVDAQGTAAQFNQPHGVDMDSKGNLFVADTINHVIRRVATDGTVSTFAGSGKPGFADGKGGLAQFNEPSDVAVGPDDKVYIADRANQRIRVAAADGTVTTLAGQSGAGWTDGTGSGARFYNPYGIDVNAKGVVFVADYSNRRIRRILADGTVTTLAGNGQTTQTDGTGDQASFHTPIDVVADGHGNLLVVDHGGHRVRHVTAAGVVTTVAGSSLGFQDGKGAAASFNYPRAITQGTDGAFWIADQNNHRIRRVTLDGTVTTPAGSGVAGSTDGDANTARLYSPRGLVFDSTGTLFVGDTANHRMRRVRFGSKPCAIDGLCYANGTVDPANACRSCDGVKDGKEWTPLADGDPCGDGNLCTAKDACKAGTCAGATVSCDDGDKCTADSCDATTGACVNKGIVGCDNFCVQASDCDDKNACTDDACVSSKCLSLNNTKACDDGNACTVGDTCKDGKCGPGTAAWVQTLAGSTQGYLDAKGDLAKFDHPIGIAANAAGVVFVGDYDNNRVRKVLADGTTSTLAGGGTQGLKDGTGDAAWFNRPSGVDLDSSGNLFVADRYSHAIRKVTPAGVVTTIAGNGVASWADATGADARFNQPMGIAVATSGAVYVGDYANHRVRVIHADGKVTTLAGAVAGYQDGTGADARFNGPIGVAVDGSGNVFVVDRNNHRIRRVSAGGVVTTVAGSGAYGGLDGDALKAQFRYPWGIALDSAGRLFIADTNGHAVRELVAGVVSTLAGSAAGTTDGVGTIARFNTPTGIAVDPMGTLWVADYGNNRLRSVRPTAGSCDIASKCWSGGVRNPAAACESCDAAKSTKAWSAKAAGDACEDGNVCTTTDKCDAGGKCAGAATECDDKDACTVDTCDGKTGACLHANSGAPGC